MGVQQPTRADTGMSLASRLLFVDVLRALAVCRVVLNHALPWGWMYWFPALPTLFFFSGTLVARSLRARPAREVLTSRFLRLALPLAVYMAFSAVMVVTGLIGSTTIHLWYVWTFLLFTALSGILRWMLLRAPLLVLGGIGGACAGLGLLAAVTAESNASLASTAQSLSITASYLLFWLLGMYWAQRDFGVPARNVLWSGFVAGGVVAVCYTAYMHDGLDLTVSANAYGMALAGTGIAVTSLAFLYRDKLEMLMRVRGLGSFFRYISHRLLTIYLWHIPAVGLGHELADALDLRPVAANTVVLVVTVALTALATIVFGPLEDMAVTTSRKRRAGAAEGRSAAQPS